MTSLRFAMQLYKVIRLFYSKTRSITISLEVLPHNEAAISAYKKAGFTDMHKTAGFTDMHKTAVYETSGIPCLSAILMMRL